MIIEKEKGEMDLQPSSLIDLVDQNYHQTEEKAFSPRFQDD